MCLSGQRRCVLLLCTIVVTFLYYLLYDGRCYIVIYINFLLVLMAAFYKIRCFYDPQRKQITLMVLKVSVRNVLKINLE